MRDSVFPSDHVIILLCIKFSQHVTTFSAIVQNLSEGQKNVSEDFPNILRRFSKITEDCRRLPNKIRICFDHTATYLKAVKGTNMLSK